MKIIGMLRVRNEARWIGDVLDSIIPLCEHILVFDDHSDDGTPALCEEYKHVTVIRSTFEDRTDETRDKNALLAEVKKLNPDYVLHIDGDEILAPNGPDAIRRAIEQNPQAGSFSMRVLYLWNGMNQVRTDGVYGRFSRGSLFRLVGQPASVQFRGTQHGGNFHCGNIPDGLRGPCAASNAALLHLGYMHQEDRIRKYRWYNQQDPDNLLEDRYRHIVQGDISHVPAFLSLRHAGPLKLEPLEALEHAV